MLVSAMPNNRTTMHALSAQSFARAQRRFPAILASTLFVILGNVYFFRWGPVIQHLPRWESPHDLVLHTFVAAIALAHGHLDQIYSGNPHITGHGETGFLSPPGFLILLAPLAALTNTVHDHVLQFPHHVLAQQIQEWVSLGPYVLVLSCSVLFAADALAERLGVAWSRRVGLALVEGVLLWNVTVLWGHPEDAVALACALYAFVCVLDDRWKVAGWLFGLGLAVQPLVIVLLPILLALGGTRRALGLVLRGILPAVVITIPPLVANFHGTVHAVVTQPSFPNRNHATPWTVFAPRIGGTGSNLTVGGGPLRVVALVLAGALGWWARRWREKPEMLVWAVALALALRCYTESVLTAYYAWPALAVGVVVAARAADLRYLVAIVAAVWTTIVGQWRLGEFPWWMLDVTGITAVVVAAARPGPPIPTEPRADLERQRILAARGRPGPPSSQKKRKRKAARASRKVTARR